MTRQAQTKSKSKSPAKTKPAKRRRQPWSSRAWLGLMIVSCAWMFFLGVLVGRGTVRTHVPIDKLQQELDDLRAEFSAMLASRAQQEAPKDKKPELGFYKELTNTKDSLARDQLLPESALKEPKKTEKKVAVGKPKPKKKIKTTPTPPAREIKTAPKSTAAQPRPSPSVSKGAYMLQVASFKKVSQADRLVSQLRRKGYTSAYREAAKIKGRGLWQRVKIGPYRSRAKAQSDQKRLLTLKLKAILIKS